MKKFEIVKNIIETKFTAKEFECIRNFGLFGIRLAMTYTRYKISKLSDGRMIALVFVTIYANKKFVSRAHYMHIYTLHGKDLKTHCFDFRSARKDLLKYSEWKEEWGELRYTPACKLTRDEVGFLIYQEKCLLERNVS
jgi:hypothetical protein